MPFWEFWSDDTGFNRTAWVRHYYSRPGATRNATRNRIERLVQALHPLRVIELNAYPYATKRERDLTTEMKDGRVLALMLDIAKPKAIFLFGREPARVVGAMLGIGCPLPGTIQPARVFGQATLVIAETHLSRGWSYERVAQEGAQVRQIVCQGPASGQLAR
ncbi:hypothetical protein DBR42_15355 [Pelomonas sp. HMWF004]|nr:hypothetical protein DBR42_15355 [Pelomonas sp. HMWF004]